MNATTSFPVQPTSASVASFFLLQFLEVAHPVASELTGGAETETETGDGAVPTRIDSEEDEDETGTDDDKD